MKSNKLFVPEYPIVILMSLESRTVEGFGPSVVDARSARERGFPSSIPGTDRENCGPHPR